MADKTVVVGSSGVTAPQLKDFFRQIEDGSLGHYQIQAMLEHRNPFAFERNEHGHVIIAFTGLDLTGAQEVERLASGGYRAGGYAKSCFTSTAKDSYDANHRLVAGQSYKLSLVLGKEIKKDSDRTTANLRKLGMEKYGYGKPLGGHIPRTRETISDGQMEEMEIQYIASLHDPITDADGDPDVLSARRFGGGLWVYTCWDDPGRQWSVDGAFAFPVPAS